MNEQTPEFIKRQQEATLEAARELLKAKVAETPEGKPFRPDYKQKEIQEGVEAIVKPTHTEAGVELDEVYPEERMKEGVNKILTFKQKAEKVEQLRNSTASPNDQMLGLIEALDEEKEAA